MSSPSTDGVNGAMQVFVEFVRSDVSEDQLLPVLRELLPVLMQILMSPAVRDLIPESDSAYA